MLQDISCKICCVTCTVKVLYPRTGEKDKLQEAYSHSIPEAETTDVKDPISMPKELLKKLHVDAYCVSRVQELQLTDSEKCV